MLPAVRAPFRCALVSLVCIVASSVSAYADDVNDAQAPELVVAESLAVPTLPPLQEPVRPEPQVSGSAVRRAFERREALAALTASYHVLQAADVVSTTIALKRGLREANPVLRGIAGNPLALSLVKASTTAATVLMTYRLARRHRLAASLVMAGLDGTFAMIVTRNLRAVYGR